MRDHAEHSGSIAMTSLHASSRRRFLRGVGGAAAGTAAAPYVITSRALGDATTPPASDRIVMGGIGLGNMGSGDQGAFLGRRDVQYVAVCDVRTPWREQAKQRVDAAYDNTDCAACVDFRELLARDDIDAVHVATPDHWHSVMTTAACRAGKDVYLQKPETLTLAEGPLMIAAARRHGRVVSGGSQRVLGDYRSIVDPCWAGELGGIRVVDVELGIPSMLCFLPGQPPPPDIDWNLWLGPAPWEPYNAGRCDGNYGTAGNSWRSYVDYSGGHLTDWGAHNMGGALFAAGLHEAQPTAVTFHPPAADAKEAAFVSLAYPGAVTVHVNRPQRLRTEAPAVTHDRAIRIAGDGGGRPARPVPVHRGGSIYADFIECVKTRERPFRDLEPAVNTMVALHLAGLALRLERSLTWDPATQRFPGDDDANRFLDRARREPWIL
jgi:predicted dehydrogenase